ncbi:sigma-70 family RNA polymerase sigma factor [Jonesia quinghaiensis]|uniref:sigma-70 family RNA polymerase sigma factor n=1 Tax=Jonesia quinghaiensis TaxID=262806 RepID=UPI000685516C|nr:sigma-70 family RNA polymerase sigma factor [Jonesia quinghaiensis]
MKPAPMRTWTEDSADADLITATRDGDRAAFALLYARHQRAGLNQARRCAPYGADPHDIVAEAFTGILAAFDAGSGPQVSFRAYLLTSIRRVGHRLRQQREDPQSQIPDAADTEPFSVLERNLVHEAFRSLPPRWQSVLWYTEVEGLTMAEIADVLDLSLPAVSALAYRAREGLRDAYLQHHLQPQGLGVCNDTWRYIGSYVRGTLNLRDTAKLERHLEECDKCVGIVDELAQVFATHSSTERMLGA